MAARHYTLAEATALLEELGALVLRLQAARATLLDPELPERLARHVPGNGGGEDARLHVAASLEMSQGLQRLSGWGIVVRDVETGLCDLPARREGRDIYLCWRVGEERIDWWHEVDGGFRGRQPIDDLIV